VVADRIITLQRFGVAIKNLAVFAILIVVLAGLACKKTDAVQFCEGVNTDGTGVRCGKVFTTGDLAVRFQHSSAFGTETVRMKFYDVNSGSKLPVETRSVEVKADSNTVITDLSLYDEGLYKIVFETPAGDSLGEGTIEIVDNIGKSE